MKSEPAEIKSISPKSTNDFHGSNEIKQERIEVIDDDDDEPMPNVAIKIDGNSDHSMPYFPEIPRRTIAPHVFPTIESTIVPRENELNCDNCHRKFNYLNTFITHKKFYCKPLTSESEADSNSILSPGRASTSQATTSVVTRTAETSVL